MQRNVKKSFIFMSPFSLLYSVPVHIFIISFSISVLFSQRTHVHLIDLVKSFPTSIYYLPAKNGFDKAENEPSKVCQEIVKRLDRLSQTKHRHVSSYIVFTFLFGMEFFRCLLNLFYLKFKIQSEVLYIFFEAIKAEEFSSCACS